MTQFLSSTSLVICGLLALLMIGIVYLLKRKKDKEKTNYTRKTFIALYIVTFILLIIELVFEHAFAVQETYPLYTLIISKLYIYLGLIWNTLVILYYMFLYRKNKECKPSYEFSKKINTFIICISIVYLTMVIVLPISYNYLPTGMCVLDGMLNSVYNIIAIVCNAFLILFIIIKNKYLPKQLIVYSILIFALYIVNYILEGVFSYAIKDAIFIYSLFVSILYFITESQDKQMLVEYNDAKNLSLEVDKQKTKFLLNMSHEIRTPLNTILGYSEYLLLEEKLEKEKVEREGDNVYQASETLLSLINNILDISRIESGKETLVENEYKIEDLIFDINSKISAQAALKNNVKFTIEVSETIPAKYHGDLAKIQRTVHAILLNAVEHTTLGEVKLSINVEKIEEQAKITFLIKNTGHAMDENKFNISFDDITSIDTEHNIDNNTLGTIIAKNLIKILGGTIEFKNEINQGTQYIIKLEQKIIGEEQLGNIYEKIRNLKGEKLINCEGKTALVVDDNAINLTIAKRLLLRFGFAVETCLTGQECLNLVKEKQYDMIFLDHMMPVMDGVETLNRLKAENKDVPPTIALTANAADNSKNEYISLGFTDYLTKPIDMKELNKILINIFEKDN